jgi:nicotinamidase-related amidase
MALTKLDERTALVVIDLQKGIITMPALPHSIVDVVERTTLIARTFRESGLPVVLVNVDGIAPGRTDAGRFSGSFPPDWAEIVPELKEYADHIVTKQRPGAFHGTGLDNYLREHNVTQIVLTGVSTSNGVESTARSAYDLGYHVTLVADAISDRHADTHWHSVEKIFPRLGEVTKTDEILKFLPATK